MLIDFLSDPLYGRRSGLTIKMSVWFGHVDDPVEQVDRIDVECR